MRIVLAPWGTRGDIQPMIALGRGLIARGHGVVLAGPKNFGGWAEAEGMHFVPVGTDVEQLMREMGDTAANVVHQTRYLLKELIPLHFEKLPAICEGADVIVGAGVQFAARSIAEHAGIPYAYVAYVPVTIPSAYHPPFFIRNQQLPRWVNRTFWRLFGVMSRGTLGRAVGTGRARLGLPPIRDVMAHLTNIPLLLAVDPALAHCPPDLPSNVQVTGALRLATDEPLGDDLARFLDDGPAPVLVGFGSMVSDRSRELVRLFIGAARKEGFRLLIQTGWTGVRRDELDLSSDARLIGPAPHVQLLPRVQAVVHHGGAGTTTAVATAGKPQLILPHLLDQFYWAHRVQELRLGPRGVPVHRLRTATRATSLLRDLVRTGSYADHARDLAGRLDRMDGVAETVRVVESLVA